MIYANYSKFRRNDGETKNFAGRFSEKIDLTPANLSILKTGKAKAIRFSTLEAICRELDCQPGDILEYREEGE